jgi:dTDP-4-dehydrorhamnose 3,5-epimerase
MKFTETSVVGAWIVEPELHLDERGAFARTWDVDEFAERGLESSLVQCSISHNLRRGTLRGLHYQVAPHEETKLVRCTRGAIFDVAVDLRCASPTFKHWCSVELTADNRIGLYVPKGCAHGFLTLVDDSEVLYQMTAAYAPEAARGMRYDDPSFGIDWPDVVVVINDRDRSYPDFEVDE